MKQPTLVILAAGLGSRFGGSKQTTPVDEYGHLIIDFSIYDAWRAGFRRVIFVIKPDHEQIMREKIGDRLEKYISVGYAHQKMDDLPEGFSIPQGREKPWGTMHALLAARDMIAEPFAVINADDFYGCGSFKTMYQFLTTDVKPARHAMIGYPIENTLTENGSVSRGVCQKDEHNCLTEIVERTDIYKRPGGAVFVENGGETFVPAGTPVSMNFWGFSQEILAEAWARFPAFLKEKLPVNPLKCEYFLPLIPDQLIHERAASFSVLPTNEKWYGVTYPNDLPGVEAAIRALKDQGVYPEKLWE